MFAKVHNYLNKLTTGKFISVITVLTFIVAIPVIPIFAMYESNDMEVGGIDIVHELQTNPMLIISLLLVFLVIVAPISETFIYQYLVLKIYKKLPFIGKYSGLGITISAIWFGWAHRYSMAYAIYSFMIGLVLAYAFMMYEYKKASSFWVVCAIHSLRNLVSFAVAAVYVSFLL